MCQQESEYVVELVRSIHTLGRSRERGRKRVPLDGPPTCSLQPLIHEILIVPIIPYQDNSLCDWRASSCAAHGHLQIRHVSFRL
jgi:hypothetical protein